MQHVGHEGPKEPASQTGLATNSSMNEIPNIHIVTDGEGGETIGVYFGDIFVSINRDKSGKFDKIIFKNCKIVKREYQDPISHEYDNDD